MYLHYFFQDTTLFPFVTQLKHYQPVVISEKKAGHFSGWVLHRPKKCRGLFRNRSHWMYRGFCELWVVGLSNWEALGSSHQLLTCCVPLCFWAAAFGSDHSAMRVAKSLPHGNGIWNLRKVMHEMLFKQQRCHPEKVAAKVVFVEVTDLPLLELGPAVTIVIKVTMLLFSIWLVRFIPTTLHFEIRTGHLQFLHFGDVAQRISDVSVAVLYPGTVWARQLTGCHRWPISFATHFLVDGLRLTRIMTFLPADSEGGQNIYLWHFFGIARWHFFGIWNWSWHFFGICLGFFFAFFWHLELPVAFFGVFFAKCLKKMPKEC